MEQAKKIMKHRIPSKASIVKKLIVLYGLRNDKKSGPTRRLRADKQLKEYEKDEIRKAKTDCCRDNQTEESILEEAVAIRKALNQYAGLDAIYVGRPYHQGYRVPNLKHGSMLANPFSLKDFGSSQTTILSHYTNYIQTRLASQSKEELIQALLAKYGITLVDRPHLQLDIVGNEFQDVLDQHQSKKLACVCKLTEPCHVDILLGLEKKKVVE
jgi:hypothetical protein